MEIGLDLHFFIYQFKQIYDSAGFEPLFPPNHGTRP